MVQTPLIECRGLTKDYLYIKEGPVKAVDNVDFEIRSQDFLVIVGHSGAGKTTLLNLIGGLERPTSGSVILDGETLEKMSDKKLASIRMKKIGFVFQGFNLLQAYTAFENIEVALAPSNMSKRERRERVSDLLQAFGLTNRASHLPLGLSLGQQQKVAIARALANNPVLLLADEPTGELDPVSASEVISKFVELNHRHKVTLIVATHGTFPYDIANRVVYMKDGRIVNQKEAGY